MSPFQRPGFYALWALVAFWGWALQVATGFLDRLIAAESGRRSGMIRMLDDIAESLLVEPFGRPVAVVVIALLGVFMAWLTYRRLKALGFGAKGPREGE